MLKTEALDFLMDPRGIAPEDVMYARRDPIPCQLEFIAGHEFAHYILGHLSDSNVVDKPIYFALSSHDHDYKPIKVYNQSQKDEFKADIQSILLPQRNPKKAEEIFKTTLFWFGCLELYETVRDTMYPQNP